MVEQSKLSYVEGFGESKDSSSDNEGFAEEKSSSSAGPPQGGEEEATAEGESGENRESELLSSAATAEEKVELQQ